MYTTAFVEPFQRHPDGSAVTSEWLHKTIAGHPKWQNVEFIQTPRFIVPAGKTIGYTATVFTEVANDRGVSIAKRLLQTDVLFHSSMALQALGRLYGGQAMRHMSEVGPLYSPLLVQVCLVYCLRRKP